MRPQRLDHALQYFEQHGEVRPANWQEGSRTIKTEPDSSKEFFSVDYADA